MEINDPIIILIVALFIGLILLYHGIINYRRRAMIIDIPRSNINSLAMGLVEIHGAVKGAHKSANLLTPFSKTECVHYSYEIEEKRKSGKNSTRWATIAKDQQGVKFIALDETGEVVIDPTDAEFNLEVHREYKHDSGFFGGASRFFERMSNWDQSDSEMLKSMPMSELEPVNSSSITWYTIGDRRIREYCLELGETLFLIGTAKSDPTRVGEALICKGANNPLFLIGDKSEKEMLSSLKWKIILQLGIGSILIPGCLYFFFG